MKSYLVVNPSTGEWRCECVSLKHADDSARDHGDSVAACEPAGRLLGSLPDAILVADFERALQRAVGDYGRVG